ncbi:MAG: cytochrome c, partial [Gammaproteobacteria bacterium]
MKCIKGFLWLAIIALIAGVVVMLSGVINVAATNPHHPVTRFILSTTMDNSVRAHARGITAPPLDDARMVMEGFRHYREMCVECHLAPGITSTEISEGLMPRPPRLQDEVEEWKPEELFWVTKNGVKMSGMPAWGPTHSDAKIWAIVAFLEKLPHMTAEQYQEMDRTAGAGEGDEHDHAAAEVTHVHDHVDDTANHHDADVH